jgi:hypothetical protein
MQLIYKLVELIVVIVTSQKIDCTLVSFVPFVLVADILKLLDKILVSRRV